MIENIDNELVIRLQTGDVGAFDTLYWKYHQAVYANILKLAKDEEVAQDILQEVFITLWEKRSVLDASQSVSGWLFVISYNKSISYLKKALKEPIVSIGLEDGYHLADDAIKMNVREAQFQLLEQAIRKLSLQKRRVFELCKLQGKTYEEAANKLNISKHTVKEYLSSATSDIKDYIKKHPEHFIVFISPILLS